ncbi:cytochrome c oxidase assembly protein [Cellulomonas denverensis]|uniref:cytochrome c oxidase assembly protein n=1 Tax=Cellulomonas denverensis TaxID=264297 RepID=UPI0035F07F5E
MTTAATTARPRTTAGATRIAALAIAGVAAVVAGVAFSGAADPVLLRDPGALVRWGLPVVTTLSELAASLTLGGLVLLATVLPRRQDTTLVRAAAGVTAASSAAWTLIAVLELVLTYANVAGLSPSDPAFGAELGRFVTGFELGRVLLTAVIAAGVVTALSLLVTSPVGAAWTAVLVLVALWQTAQTGHASGAASHDLATSSMFLHLIGAALWIGVLAALAPLAQRLGRDLAPAVARFSVIAGWCFALVAVSGIVNSLVRLGTWSDLGTRYGLLLLVKIALFGVLGLLGLLHRRAVVAKLTATDGPVTRLFWRLVLVELAVMGAVSGVAVALGSTAPPVPDDPIADPTPAEIVTGHALPPEPTTLSWVTQWRWDVLLASAAVAGIVVYLRWAARLRRRGDAWPWARTASWVTGMLVFFWTTSGGPAMYGHVLFSAHMVQHMLLAMVIPVLLALSAPVTLALRALPSRGAARPGQARGADTSRGPREWLLALVHSRWGRFFANPVIAAVNFAGSMIVFYYTGIFGWALESGVGHYAMVLHFSLAGYLFANALVGIDPGPTRPGYPQRLLLLFATMAFHAFFGVALVTGEVLLVPDWFGNLGWPWGPSALEDQQRGGGVAWGIGELPTLALAIGVALAWSRDDERTARRRDRKVDRDGDAELDAYNAMLAGLAERDRTGVAPDRDRAAAQDGDPQPRS